jgi:hypothetical protein
MTPPPRRAPGQRQRTRVGEREQARRREQVAQRRRVEHRADAQHDEPPANTIPNHRRARPRCSSRNGGRSRASAAAAYIAAAAAAAARIGGRIAPLVSTIAVAATLTTSSASRARRGTCERGSTRASARGSNPWADSAAANRDSASRAPLNDVYDASSDTAPIATIATSPPPWPASSICGAASTPRSNATGRHAMPRATAA